jgi:outer membrane receptor protein involved in Fe transport
MDRRNIERWARCLAGAALAVAVAAGFAYAGTTGKLSGRVTTKKKEPIQGANIIVIGRPLGAASDADGRFTILNVPPGKISVKVSMIGYGVVTTENLEVNADLTTRFDVELSESAVQMQEVVVSARRAIVDVNRTSNIATVSREQLQALPVQELQDVVNLQAGVVDGHFRGGRDNEVQYQVDGVSVNNAYDNKSSLRLDRSLLEEVQVISGTFDAEYGQAMSGVVNCVLKRGTEKFQWDAEAFTGGPVYSSGAKRIMPNDQGLAAQQNYQVTIDGPLRLPKTTYLLSGRAYHDDNWIRYERVFNPWDASLSPGGQRVLQSTGDRSHGPLGYSQEYSGVVKVTNRALKNVEVSYQALFDVVDGRNSNWAWRYEPDGMTKQHTLSVVEGVDLTHTLSPTRFYTLSVRQNYKKYTDYAFADIWDPRYDAWGPAVSVNDPSGINGIISGVDLGRFYQRTNGGVFKGSYVDQRSKDRQIKLGAEFQAPHMEFGSPGYLQYYADSLTGASVIHRRTAYDPKFPGVLMYHPFIGAAFAQEELEWNDLKLRAGLRFEYFDARSTYPSDLSNPANSIAGAPRSHLVKASAKTTIAPRLGVSYPISSTSSLFFAYGHFYQLPGLGEIFSYADYNRLSDLQATDNSVPVMGNPDIRPEKTVQYQFGYKNAVSDYLGLDLTAFYKDIRDLLGTQIIETYNGAQYARMANADFGSVTGFTLTLTQRGKGMVSSKVDYTWQTAQGNSSDPAETANRAAAGEDASPRSVPFNWDQRHTLNTTITIAKPDQFNISTIVRLTSGQPYTPLIATGFSGGLETNSGRKPGTLEVDVRAEKTLRVYSHGARGFLRVFNLLDTRFDNGFVFPSSGDPYYSRFAGTDYGMLADPTRYYGPRRIEAGLTLNAGN